MVLFGGTVSVQAESPSLPDDATPLQRAIYEALKAAKEANETVPDAEYLSYSNGTTLTVLTYENGTQRHIRETFAIKNVTIAISPDSPLFLPINTTDEEATEYLTKIQDILMGFTFQIPRYEWSFDILGIAEGGIIIDIGFGLRLPIQVKLEYPEIMVTKRLYTLYTSVNGLDWSATDYANAGLQPDENEFLCKFYFRAWLWTILTGSLFDFEIDFDESRSFSTPLGLGETFPLPRIPVPLNPIVEWLTGIVLDPYVYLTLEIGPNLGSDKVTANWSAENGAIGSGSFLWSYNNERLSFDVQTQNFLAEAKITLAKFRYWFTIFTVDFTLLINFEDALDFLNDIQVPLFTLDLSDIIGSLDLYVGVHEYTIGTVFVTVSVVPEAPLGTISLILVMVGALGLFVVTKPKKPKSA